MQALSFDLRQRLVRALEARDKRAHIATRFQVSGSSLYRLHRQWKTTGDLAPKKRVVVPSKLSGVTGRQWGSG